MTVSMTLNDLAVKVGKENDFFLDLLMNVDAALAKRFVSVSAQDLTSACPKKG